MVGEGLVIPASCFPLRSSLRLKYNEKVLPKTHHTLFFCTSLLSSAHVLSLIGTSWPDSISGLVHSRAWFCFFVYSWSPCMFIASKEMLLWDSESTLGGSLNLEIWIIIPMNSSEMLLAISRESQLMIFLHSEVTENNHIVSHTDWIWSHYKDWFVRQLNNSVSLAS